MIKVKHSLISSTFYLEYGLYFACGLYAQHTQRDKVLQHELSPNFSQPVEPQMPFGNGQK